MSEAADALSAAGRAARRLDRERFLAALGAPAARRDALFAVIAFNGELARAREAATDQTLGLIRLQWWRDLTTGLRAGDPAVVGKHEIGSALAEALTRLAASGDEATALIDGMIDAREEDLEPEPPTSDAAFMAYVDATAGAVTRLSVRLLLGDAASSIAPDGATERAAALVGRAYGVAGLLRATPFRLRYGRLDWPLETLERHGAVPADLRAGTASAPVRMACADLAGQARVALAQARALRVETPRAARTALLVGVWAEIGLNRLAAAGYDPFALVAMRPAPFAALRLALASWRGRY